MFKQTSSSLLMIAMSLIFLGTNSADASDISIMRGMVIGISTSAQVQSELRSKSHNQTIQTQEGELKSSYDLSFGLQDINYRNAGIAIGLTYRNLNKETKHLSAEMNGTYGLSESLYFFLGPNIGSYVNNGADYPKTAGVGHQFGVGGVYKQQFTYHIKITQLENQVSDESKYRVNLISLGLDFPIF